MLPVSVNFSLYEFYSANFLDTIINILDEYKVPSNLIEIEITEATSQANSFLSISIIKKLKERGIRVLMDDFGVGFSNLSNMKKIPFDAIKIDKSFIDDICNNENDKYIANTIISLAHQMNIAVVAEGVESQEQLEILQDQLCDTLQGYLFSKPVTASELAKIITVNKTLK